MTVRRKNSLLKAMRLQKTRLKLLLKKFKSSKI
jgi:hypothetical protein